MAYDMEHLFICLARCLLKPLAHFLIGLFVFLLLNFKSSLYILDGSLLSGVSFVTQNFWLCNSETIKTPGIDQSFRIQIPKEIGLS